ncbi:MAG: acetoacetate--CoA ligase [Ilumatobacteraceae bacterium]
MNAVDRGRVIWSPPANAWADGNLSSFATHVLLHDGPECGDYRELLAWSLAEPDRFWWAFADWAGLRWHDRAASALDDPAMPGTEWFPGATLNYAEHALAHASRDPHGLAVIARSQTRPRVERRWNELLDDVGRCRAGLQRLGVGKGDRVVAYAPNIPETLVAFLATASLGAVWSSCAPEFGVRAVTDRWSQIEPKVLIAVDGYRYGARSVGRAEHVAEIVAALPSLDHVVRIPYLDPGGEDGWAPLLREPAPIEFTPVAVDHPLYVLFSSGTTGLPKPIVHGHGGITLEHTKALSLHYDLRPGERFSWFTTTGWMMWNFVVSGLLTGSTVVLFDGDPASPDLLELWRLAAEERVDVFGVSAPFVMACRKAGIRPGDELDLESLRHVGSTGAPLPSEGFEWIVDAVGRHVQPGSMSGGTDVCTAFVGPAPTEPVRSGEITNRMLGCDVQAFTAAGERCRPGETGELVITSPMPSMPVALWGDESGERLRRTYFATFPGVWHHGDWITFHDDGACEITGRSDATLNLGGVRLGTSDFYTVVEGLPEVADSVVVHLEDGEGGPGELILLVATSPGHELDDDLRGRIRGALRSELSPRHVPDVIDTVPAVPRTLSGKKLEVPLKKMLLGADANDVVSRDSLADPSSLDQVARWIETRVTPGV